MEYCPLKDGLICGQENVYGACFFCNKVVEGYAVSKIPILETDIVSYKDEV